jgi:hypothetical protein
MTAVPSIDMSGWLHEQLDQASPDLLRGMVRSFAQALMSAESTRSAAPATASAATTGPTPATGTGTASGTPGPGRSTWRSRSCGRGPISRLWREFRDQ